MESVRETLGRRLLFGDGAMGTMLQRAGLSAGEVPEVWNLQHPEILKKLHASYLDAGADWVTANTFGANPIKFESRACTWEEALRAGVGLAAEAAHARGKWAALDIGPTGRLLAPMGDLSFEEAYRAFFAAAKAGADAGADLILVETMSDTLEMKAAVLACRDACDLPVFATMTFDEHGKLLTGGDLAAAAVLLESLHVDAAGLNCGLGPVQMVEFLPQLRAHLSVPLLVQPNAGLPQVENGETVYPVEPDEFAASMEKLWEEGAWLLGGCCGTTPAHIAALVQKLSGKAPKPLPVLTETAVSSYSHAVFFGGRTVLIGERINPTGKKRLQQALREGDMGYVLREGVAQQEAGAEILDVNVGLPELDEPKILSEAVQALQGVTDLPLQIDSSDPAALERALRCYNGKALLNSVNGKQEVMDAVFPLVKRYGCAVIALTLDENGIPETARGRLQIAEKIVKEAEKYGIPRRDLIVDTLAMTISAGQEAARVTLDALELVQTKLGLCTSLGISNISFGLPHRERVTAAFFTMAMQKGLSAAILNPKSAAILDSWRSFNALMGYDKQCLDYIAYYQALPKSSPQKAAPAAPQDPLQRAAQALIDAGNALGALSKTGLPQGESGRPFEAAAASEPEPGPGALSPLARAVQKGLTEDARREAQAALQTSAPLDLIQNALVPALDEVGSGYESGRLFLPQLLMSADAATAAFEVIRQALQKQGVAEQKKGTIVLATVKGDIHDIGKNIVKVLLENYDYEVIDLGRDVDPQVVVDAVKAHKAPLCGLSALMTTTVVHMEETIRLLHEQCPQCRVMVGGAVLNETYAEKIHADAYNKDAMGCVRYAAKIFGEGAGQK